MPQATIVDFNGKSAHPFGENHRASPSHPRADGGAAERDPITDGARAQAMLEAFVSAVERLEDVLEQETQMLDRNRPILLHDFNHRKSHGLLELSRAMVACRALDRVTFDIETSTPLARLRVKLESNLASLQTHLTAVGEIAAVISRAIQDHKSDGTYTAGQFARGDRE